MERVVGTFLYRFGYVKHITALAKPLAANGCNTDVAIMKVQYTYFIKIKA